MKETISALFELLNYMPEIRNRENSKTQPIKKIQEINSLGLNEKLVKMIQARSPKGVKQAIDRGADTGYVTPSGQSILNLAIASECLEVIRLVLNALEDKDVYK